MSWLHRVLAGAVATLLVLATAPSAAADDPPDIPWTGTNPYGFAVGDSVLQSCGEQFGMGWRSLGFIGWPGADTSRMRARLDGTGPATDWPTWTVTEPSLDWEKVWFRDAGWLVVALGTNDVKTMTADAYRANVDWFMQQSRGRPVLWFNIVNEPFRDRADQFNGVLADAADRWPNLKVIDWRAYVDQNPSVVWDGVHLTTDRGCIDGRNRLIQLAAPDVPGSTKPVGHWYLNPSRSGPVVINGWGAGNSPSRQEWIAVNVRSDGGHVGRVPVNLTTGDIWANAASGRGFGFPLTENFRGHYICLDLVDAAEQFTSLGCRTP